MDLMLYQGINYCLACGAKLRISEDREGKTRPNCPACGWVYYKNPIPVVAILALNENNELLLVKRKFEPNAGDWALPSGYMEVYLSPEENALAELEEETGLTGEISHCIGWHYGYSPLYHRVLSLGFRIRICGGQLQAGDDALEAKFVPLDALPPIAFKSHCKFIQMEIGLRPI